MVKRRVASPPSPHVKLVITGLDKNLNEQHLQLFIESVAPVISIKLERDEDSTTNVGYGFVVVDKTRAPAIIEQLNGWQHQGLTHSNDKLQIEYAKS